VGDQSAARQQTAIGIKLFGRTFVLTGRSAIAFLLVVPAILAAVTIRYAIRKPESFKAALMSPLWISAALWIVMMVYWNAAARKSAPVKSGESSSSRARHQLLLNVALLLAFIRFPWTGARWLPASPLTPAIGLAIQAGSMVLDVWAMRCLGRNWSGAVTIKVDHQLIRTGPYRLVRHPIYTAMIGMYLGTAIVSGELHGLFAVVLCMIAYWRKTRMEERGLREVFGQAYDDYRRASWALIPFVF
jgi:protein-S-isoprenylcysteine O-methyltransferase Ste14